MDLMSIMLGALAISVLHAALPDHWLPFVLVGKAQGWSRRKIMRIASSAGGGHVLVTTILGVATATVAKMAIISIEGLASLVSGGVLVCFGLYYVALGLRQTQGGHRHSVEDGLSERLSAISLFTMLTFSPCSAMIPLFVATIPAGWDVLPLLFVTVTVSTIGSMLVLIYLTSLGYQRLRSPWLERNERIVIGAVLIALGLWVFVSG